MNANARELVASVNWSSLRHAFGPATDLPDLLQQLISGKQRERDRAIFELFGNIWHQGTVYSASAPAARVLLAMVGDPTTPDRSRILGLLGSLASGCDQDNSTRPCARETREAVATGLSSFVAALTDDDAALREAATWVLSRFPEHAAQLLPPLIDRLQQEKSELVRAGLILGIGCLAHGRVDVVDGLVRICESNLDPLPIRVCAAISVANLAEGASAACAENLLLDPRVQQLDDALRGGMWSADAELKYRVEDALTQLRAAGRAAPPATGTR